MPYILKEKNIEEFVKKSEIDEFEEEDFDTIINLITTYEEKQGKVSRQDMAFRH